MRLRGKAYTLNSHIPQTAPRLAAQLAQLHAIITGTPSTAPEEARPALCPRATTEGPSWPSQSLTHRPADLPAAQVHLARPEPLPLAEVADLDALPTGPRRLLELLYDLALHVHAARRHALVPSQIVLHQAQELIGRALGVHRITVWKWTRTLKALGYLDARPHKSSTTHRAATVTRNDGVLYCLPLKPGHRPRLRFDDLKHQYRDLDQDRKVGNTAYAVGQRSPCLTGAEWLSRLRTWATLPGQTQENPLNSDCCPEDGTAPRTVQHVIYALPLVGQAHPTKRPALVGILASGLAHALHDEHSQRYYCGLIWSAWREEREGRPGLQVLAAQLARLDIDRAEWPDLRNPAALLASRLQT